MPLLKGYFKNILKFYFFLISFLAINAFLEKDVMPMEQNGRLSMEKWDEMLQDLFNKYL